MSWNPQDIITKYNGQYLTVTGPDKGQCTAVAHACEVLAGVGIVYGNAVDTFANAPFPKFTSGTPQFGDILVFKATADNGYAGHTSMFVAGKTSFDQNYGPEGSPCEIKNHAWDWNLLIGWFRLPGVQSGGDMSVIQDYQNALNAERFSGVVLAFRAYLNREPTSAEVNAWLTTFPTTSIAVISEKIRQAAGKNGEQTGYPFQPSDDSKKLAQAKAEAQQIINL